MALSRPGASISFALQNKMWCLKGRKEHENQYVCIAQHQKEIYAFFMFSGIPREGLLWLHYTILGQTVFLIILDV